MSVELHVFISDSQMPDARQWQKVLSDIGAGMQLPTDLAMREFAGYLPVRWRGKRSGFEYFFGPVGGGWADLSDQLADRDHMVTLVPRDELEVKAAIWAAAGLARCGQGLFYDPQEGRLTDASGVLEMACKSQQGSDDARGDDEVATDSKENGDALDLGPRRARRGDALDDALDAVITPILKAQGFVEGRPYLFLRVDAGGRDIIDVEVYDDQFYVALGYVPGYMEEVNSLFDPSLGGLAPGILRLLAPTVIVRGDGKKLYPFGSPRKREQSIRLVHQGLAGIGFRWLQTLRDRSVYAAELHPVHPICTGRAWEAAGNTEKATVAYRKELARDMGWYGRYESQDEFAKSWVARTLVYAGLKLQAELEICSRLMQSGRFRLEVQPLLPE